MAEIKNSCPVDDCGFKEAVCIDAGRVYDSCCDRDCLEDLRCFFTAEAQAYIDRAISVRLKSAEVLNVLIDVQPVSFNKGFYSCDLTFFFLLDFDVFLTPNSCPTQVVGISSFNKKVILFGSDGNVKVFTNTVPDVANNCDNSSVRVPNTPRCVVQSVDPVVLTARLGCITNCYENVRFIPQSIIDYVGAPIITDAPVGTPTVYVSLGLFTIVQLIRNVQMLIPVYDFCIPEKQCEDTTDQPCDVFKRIKFPTNDFFPPRPCNLDTPYYSCCNEIPKNEN